MPISDIALDQIKDEIENYYRYVANEQNLVDTNVYSDEYMLPPGWGWIRNNNGEVHLDLMPNSLHSYISTQRGYVYNNISDSQFEELAEYITSRLLHWRNNAIHVDGARPHQSAHGKRRNNKSKRRGKSRRGKSRKWF